MQLTSTEADCKRVSFRNDPLLQYVILSILFWDLGLTIRRIAEDWDGFLKGQKRSVLHRFFMKAMVRVLEAQGRFFSQQDMEATEFLFLIISLTPSFEWLSSHTQPAVGLSWLAANRAGSNCD